MKKWLLLFLLMALPAVSEVGFTEASATDTAQSVTLNARSVLIINAGADSAYFRLFRVGETAAAATTSYARIDINESIAFTSDTNSFASVSIICDTGETATVRIYTE